MEALEPGSPDYAHQYGFGQVILMVPQSDRVSVEFLSCCGQGVKTFFPRLNWIERYDPQYVEDVEESFRNAREFVDKYVVPNAIEYHKKAEEDRYFYDKDPKYWELMKKKQRTNSDFCLMLLSMERHPMEALLWDWTDWL